MFPPTPLYPDVAGLMAACHVVQQNRYGHAGQQQRRNLAGHEGNGKSLEDGVEQNHARSNDDGRRRERHRAESHGARIDDGLLECIPSRSRNSMKSTRMIEFRTTMPAPAMKPIIEVAVKKAPRAACAGRMPASENGIAAMMSSGVLNDWNHPTTRT